MLHRFTLTLRGPLLLPAVLLSVFISCNRASAQISNGSFENGGFNLSNWTITGGAAGLTYKFGVTPVDGAYQAFLSNDLTPIDSVYGNPGQNINASVSEATLAAAVGTTTSGLNALYQHTSAVNGSAITQTFAAVAGESINFSYDFLTSEDPTAGPSNGGAYNDDFSFVTLNGADYGLTDAFTTNETGSATPISGTSPSNADYLTQSGYHTFSLLVTKTGTQTLSFGVVNGLTSPNTTSGNGVASALLVDNVSLVATPEQSTVWMFLIAIGILGASSLRFKRPSTFQNN